MTAAPFLLHYELSRAQRLAPHLLPWAPCLGASLGFSFGIIFLAKVVSLWFLPLLITPLLLCRRFGMLALGILRHRREPVDLLVGESHLELRAAGFSLRFALTGIVQVYRSEGDTWTVLNRDNTAITIPASAISEEQLRYLKRFVQRPKRE